MLIHQLAVAWSVTKGNDKDRDRKTDEDKNLVDGGLAAVRTRLIQM